MSLFPAVIPGESDLSVTHTDLQQALALSRGWDLTVANWEAEQVAVAPIIIKGGLRRFYGPHRWSFLTPVVPITLTVGDESYDLPDDFASMESPMYFTGTYAGQPPVIKSSLASIRQYRDVVGTGIPRQYAVEPLPHTGEQVGQRFGLHFDVKPSHGFTLHVTYRVNPYATSTDRIYPLGGQATGEALRYAVMAQGEVELGQGPGKYTERFNELLAEAIAEDIRKGPQHLGRNNAPRRNGHAASASIPVSGIFYNGNAVE